MEKRDILEKVAGSIRAHLGEEYKVFLFGSWAKGEARETSDFDVGILGEKKVPHETLLAIKREIEALPTLRSIDVVDLRTVDAAHQNSVLASAQELTHGGDFSFIQ